VFGAYSHEFPRTDHPRNARRCLDLDEYGAYVGDSADAHTLANLITYVKLHVAPCPDSTCALPRVLAALGCVTAIAARNRVAEPSIHGARANGGCLGRRANTPCT
jgi:hypothetical protein